MQVKRQQLELDMEQQTGSKLGKEYIKAVYCHPAYLTYVRSTSCEMLGWIKGKLESRLLGINNLKYADDTTLIAEREEELKSPTACACSSSSCLLRLLQHDTSLDCPVHACSSSSCPPRRPWHNMLQDFRWPHNSFQVSTKDTIRVPWD